MKKTLRERLAYEPVELRFGTSGRRGRVIDLTQLEIWINVRAELEFLKTLPKAQGGIEAGEDVFLAADLRPSSVRFAAEQGGRGEILQAACEAVRAAGCTPVFEGFIPTPALAYYGFGRRRASIMVTGSHIPFDRNGYKLNTSAGELLKEHEGPIGQHVARIRAEVYNAPFEQSPFNEHGMLKQGPLPLPEIADEARGAYRRRYLDFFRGQPLRGQRVVVYQHSAVGRDLLVEVLEALGAEAIPAGRSETFVPIDTENISDELLGRLEETAREIESQRGPVCAIVSTDGDSDRPLFVSFSGGRARFHPGDLLGLAVAQELGADAVVVPVSANDAIDRSPLAAALEPKTRIGSPYVIAGMQRAAAGGRRRVVGWEANGGFLTGSPIERGGALLDALPTRDAFLPILTVLAAAAREGVSPAALFERLPQRFGRSALLREFPREKALRILEKLTPQATDGSDVPGVMALLGRFFRSEDGFGAIEKLDSTDGLRIWFSNGDIAHLRPSGNADEFRIYAVADTQQRADAIAALGVREPDGILRRMEKELDE
ncbi:MAG: phosphomannomutase [Bryobacteraceae bacterium]|nr:MAG: phosphomannomutase [Bryobacteraceae bacterium]